MANLTPKEQKELNKFQKEYAKIEEKIQAGKKLHTKTLETHEKLHKDINKLLEKQNELGEEELSLVKQAERIIEKKLKSSRKIELSGKSNAAHLSKALKDEAVISGIIRKRIDDTGKQRNLSAEEKEISEKSLNLLGEMGTGALDLEALQSKLAQIEDEKGDKLKYQNVLGEEGYKGLTDSLKQRIKMGREEELSAQALSGIDDLTGGMGTKIKDAKDMMGKMGMKAGLAAVVIMAIVAILTDFSGKLDAIGEKFGAIGLLSDDVRGDLLAAEVEAAKLGKDFEDIVTSITTLTSEFGIGFKEARGMANEVISMSMGLGLSTSEGGQLIGILSTITGLSNDTAVALAQQTTLLATASDVAPQQVLQDIAGSSETIAKFTDASGKNILRGAIQARKLGTSLEDAASAAESMLDFQTAIEDAMTASVMIGRDINVQKLQELSLAGDLEGVSKEQRRLLGDQSDFLSMNVLQRVALAKAVGLSVDQAAKMLDHEEDAITLAGELAKQKGFEELIGPNTISELTEMMNSLKSIGAVLVNVLGPPLNMVVGLFSFLAAGLQTSISFLTQYKEVLYAVGVALALFKAKAIGAAIAGAWYKAFTGPGAVLGGPVGIALGAAAALAAVGAIMNTTKVGDVHGGPGMTLQTSPTEGGLQLSKNDQFAAGPDLFSPQITLDDLRSVFAPIIASVDKLNVDMGNIHVPNIAKSNVAGGKKAGREIGRQFQMSMA